MKHTYLIRDIYILHNKDDNGNKVLDVTFNILRILANEVDANKIFLFYDVIIHALYHYNSIAVELAVECIKSWNASEYLSDLKRVYFFAQGSLLKDNISATISTLENIKHN